MWDAFDPEAILKVAGARRVVNDDKPAVVAPEPDTEADDADGVDLEEEDKDEIDGDDDALLEDDDPQADIEGEGVVTVIDEGTATINAAARFRLKRHMECRYTSCSVGAIAQLGERYNGIAAVSGSIPLGSTINLHFLQIVSSSGRSTPAYRLPLAVSYGWRGKVT